MNSFGVIEVAGTKTTNAPGWAYVPDTGPSVGALQPTNRKRARNQPNVSHADINARQEAKLRKELEVLDRDNHRDVIIPVPPKAVGRSRNTKHTPNVRKILQSQKTFGNHLDDFQAMLALSESNPSAAANAAARSGTAANAASTTSGGARRDSKRPEPPSRAGQKQATVKEEDVEMIDAADQGSAAPTHNFLPAYAKPPPASHSLDGEPLLESRIPPMPTDEELQALMSAPPLRYVEARATLSITDKKYPTRVFCEVCGYWGRVRCIKCGTRVCALECLETHREECMTRYGI